MQSEVPARLQVLEEEEGNGARLDRRKGLPNV